LAITQDVLPFMRKQQSGHIIQISSQAGFNSSPGLGIYNASKFALEGFSEALYHELKPLGIFVTIIEPGPFKTNWAGSSMIFAEKNLSQYHDSVGKTKISLANVHGHQPGDPVKGAQAIIRMTEENDPPLRLPLGKIAIGNIRKKLDWVTHEVNRWEAVSANTDF
jgi:short-subunit dehydrogenase